MILPAPSFPPVIGESAGARIWRVVLWYIGCSLTHRRAELAALVGENSVTWETNCETFAIGVLRALGLDLPDVQGPLKNGLEGSVLEHVAARAGGWRAPVPGEAPPEGSLMHYHSVPYRTTAAGAVIYDDHVEWMGDGPDHHAGGGRPGNLIADGHGDVHWSAGRPMVGYIPPEAFGLPDAMAAGGDAAAPPEPDPAA